MGTHIVDKILHENLSDFYRPNFFQVSIKRPSSVNINNDKELIHTLIQSVSTPSVTIGSVPVKRMGKTINVPGGTVDFSDVSMTLYDDADGKTLQYFHDWQREYYGKTADLGVFNDIHTFATGTTVEIYKLDRSFNKISTTTLYNIYPSSIGEMELSHESVDTVATFTVAFNYSYMEYSKESQTTQTLEV